MPTRISAGVGDHPFFPYFLYFITMIPIDCKITNFSLHFFFAFCDHHNYSLGVCSISVCVYVLIGARV